MNKVTINGSKVYEIAGNKIDGAELLTDVIFLDDRFYHVIAEGKSFNIEIVKQDPKLKLLTLKVNNTLYEVEVKDKFDRLLDEMGFNSADAGKISELKAPMPGLVIEIRVKAGDSVAKGDAVVVLEAMKMENVLKAPGDAVVKSIAVEKGVSVDKNQVLIVFE